MRHFGVPGRRPPPAMLETLAGTLKIIFADMILSGDNALVIGMVAAGLSPQLRRQAIVLGMVLAAVLRIIFAASAVYLLKIPGILFFGGLLLCWVCWRFYRELRSHVPDKAEHVLEVKGYQGPPRRQMWNALVTITMADVSMSIDNVLAVAAIARDSVVLLVFGLALAIMLMAFFAAMIMKLMTRFPWLSWAGLLFLIYVSVEMLIEGWPHLAVPLGLAVAAS
jgi:YjbE family integral membrane protein